MILKISSHKELEIIDLSVCFIHPDRNMMFRCYTPVLQMYAVLILLLQLREKLNPHDLKQMLDMFLKLFNIYQG